MIYKVPDEKGIEYDYERYTNIGKSYDDNDRAELIGLIRRTDRENLNFVLRFNEYPNSIDDMSKNTLINSETYVLEGTKDMLKNLYKSSLGHFVPVFAEFRLSEFMMSNFSDKMIVTLYIFKGERAKSYILNTIV